MSLSFSRSNLPGAGAPKITFNSVTLWTRADVTIPLKQNLVQQVSAMYGRVLHTRGPRKIEFSLPIYGFWSNLATLFPSYLLNFTYGARMYGTSDLPMVILARNGDQLTIHNVRLTGISNLKLAANQQIFSADAKFTALIKNNTAPTDAAAYYTMATAQAYSEGDFPQSAFKSLTWTGAWGARTGFTSILTQEGWGVDWAIKTQDDLVDGIGPVDMFVEECWLSARCTPVGPTLAQLESNTDFQGANGDVGADASAGNMDNLVLTDGTSTLTIYNAAVESGNYMFAPFKKRVGEYVWTPVKRPMSAGATTALAAVA
jgi:hypothetical protein